MNRFSSLLRAAGFGLVLTFAVSAAADTAGAQAFVEQKAGQIKKLVDANAPKEDVNKVIDEMIDYDEITRRSLGQPCPTTIPNCTNHWAQLSKEQHDQMTTLYTKLVAKKVRDNAQKTKDFDVTYRGTREGKEDDINKVRTEAQDRTKPRDPPTQIDYIVKGIGPYKVVDIVTEGSILSKNYYDQSHKMLTTDGQGYNYLVGKLQDRIAGKKRGE